MKLRKHVNNTDVAIEVIKSYFVKETRTFKLKVRWWNIGKCHKPWDMGIEQRIDVHLSAWNLWEPYDER